MLETPSGQVFNPLETMPSDVPKTKKARWVKLSRRAGKSYRAAVELKCLECVAWERAEAKRCELTGCALYAFNRKIFA